LEKISGKRTKENKENRMGQFVENWAEEIRQISGVDAKKLIEIGLLHPVEARRWLVRKKYYLLADGSRTFTDIKLELSEQYGLSVSSIEKLIYRKRF
jgi:hypothetical protein